jgi:hypothetical protein
MDQSNRLAKKILAIFKHVTSSWLGPQQVGDNKKLRK